MGGSDQKRFTSMEFYENLPSRRFVRLRSRACDGRLGGYSVVLCVLEVFGLLQIEGCAQNILAHKVRQRQNPCFLLSVVCFGKC